MAALKTWEMHLPHVSHGAMAPGDPEVNGGLHLPHNSGGGRHAIKYPGDLENNGVVHLPHYSQADVALGAPQNTGEVHLSQYLQVPWRPVPWRP